ncbi:MAG: rhamnogalacturonan acetylesterase [Clostridia bacterium]|nr:rhamnogalacturonan acetylesterase [Clostridia bacterium]
MPTIFIIGDSTVEDNKPPFRGWGWALKKHVKPGVQVKNCALSGRSSLSFRNEGLFAPVEKEIAADDMLLIQFGHNDEKDDAERHTDPDTTFPENLWYYCKFALDRGAQPVLITPVARRFFTGDHSVLYTHGEYPAAVRKLAAEKGIPLCDLKADSRALYLKLGEEKTAELFVRLAPGENPDFPEGHDDKTHFNAYGAEVMAGLVAEELRAYPTCAAYLA